MVAGAPAERNEALARQVVDGAGLIALVAGLVVLRATDIGGDPVAALAAVAAQLPLTLPAAVLVTTAATLNLAGGVVLVRILVGRPLEGLRQAALAGLVGAVVFDLVLMSALGAVGAFRWPVLLAAQLALLGLGLLVRPVLAPGLVERLGLAGGPRRRPLAWLLAALVWSGPALLTLASPVVPFLDVLPNHVAPVEHLRAFGSLATLETTPSPIYGPSRIFLGYQALLGTVATTAGVAAALAVAAFALPLLLLVALAGHGLAGAIGGRAAAGWALLAVPLSVTFLRLADARAGVLALPLVAFALWLAVEPPATSPLRRALLLALTLGAALLVHPLIGLLGVATLGIAALARPERYGEAITVAAGALLVALPQWAVMAGHSVSPLAGLLGLPVGGAIVVVLVAAGSQVVAVVKAVRLPLAYGAIIATLGLVLAGLLLDARLGMEWLGRDWPGAYPVLLGGAALGWVLAWRRRGIELLAAAVAATLAAGAAAALLPGDDPLLAAARFEVPKTLAYFAPAMLAVALAVGLAALWRLRWPVLVRGLAAGALLIAMAAPIRIGVAEDLSLGEHRLAESLSISWRNAARGYWQGFPDPRTLIDRQQAELVEALRGEIRAGRLAAADEVLHVAGSFQPWASTPLAVFAGVIETMATTDPERSIHTHGGRLNHVADLPALLAGRPAYVVLEPAGLPDEVREQILDAGYGPIFGNSRGEVFARPD